MDSDRVVKISFLQPVGPKMIPEFGRSATLRMALIRSSLVVADVAVLSKRS